MAVYYIDSLAGDNENPGTDMACPRESLAGIGIKPGDTVLFRRGTSYRHGIYSPDGEEGNPITYGAYGEGESPCFYGSLNCSEEWMWEESARNVWKLRRTLVNEACNIIFDFGHDCGTLCYDKSGLDTQGKWYCTQFGTSGKNSEKPELYLYSEKNPALYYRDIETAVYGERRMLSGRRHVRFENLKISCSGVHGYAQTKPEDVIISECAFEFIGGCVWNADRKIRYGNAVEFWDGCERCTVSECTFYNIYDSCLTTQGSDKMTVPRDILFENNTFSDYGMAAYEIRDKVGINVKFRFNVCNDAGGGFSSQDGKPRRSEIYPQPMGHHIFAWRIEAPTDGGCTEIRSNIFRGVPTGCDTYMIISDGAKKQIRLADNQLQ